MMSTVTNTQVAVKYRGMSVAYRSTCRPTIGQPLSVDISTDISVECQSTYRPMLDRYVSRDIKQHISVDIMTDTQPICRPKYRSTLGRYVDRYVGQLSICRPICRLGGAQNTNDPNLLEQRLCYVVSLKPKNVLYTCYTCTEVQTDNPSRRIGCFHTRD